MPVNLREGGWGWSGVNKALCTKHGPKANRLHCRNYPYDTVFLLLPQNTSNEVLDSAKKAENYLQNQAGVEIRKVRGEIQWEHQPKLVDK